MVDIDNMLTSQTLDNSVKVLEFISFCVEIYAQENDMSGSKVIELFEKTNLLSYLSDNYEILHTQGKQYILCNISDFLKAKEETK